MFSSKLTHYRNLMFLSDTVRRTCTPCPELITSQVCLQLYWDSVYPIHTALVTGTPIPKENTPPGPVVTKLNTDGCPLHE